MNHQDCIVIGGGIIGICTARELALRGIKVCLFDKNQLGQEASHAAGGILSSMHPWLEHPQSADLSAAGKQCYQKFAADLHQQTSINPQYHQCGLLLIKPDDISLSKQWLHNRHIPFHQNDYHLPAGMQVPADAIFMPDIACIHPPLLLNALKISLQQLGVSIFEHTEITDLHFHNQRCQFLQSTHQRYAADVFIITAGAWSQQFLSTQQMNIKPIAGQILCVKFSEQPLKTMILDGNYYLIPRKDGHILIGSTIEDIGFNKRTTTQARDDLMGWAKKLWPDIAHATFKQQWAGLRPGTNHGRPYVGKLEDTENVYINAGHFRKGILQAPVCAIRIADLVCGSD